MPSNFFEVFWTIGKIEDCSVTIVNTAANYQRPAVCLQDMDNTRRGRIQGEVNGLKYRNKDLNLLVVQS